MLENNIFINIIVNTGYIFIPKTTLYVDNASNEIITPISTRLLLKLSKILNFDNLFNGFFFLIPFFVIILLFSHLVICQSPSYPSFISFSKSIIFIWISI